MAPARRWRVWAATGRVNAAVRSNAASAARGASRRLIPEGAQRAAGVAHHGVGLAGDALGDAGKLSVDPLGLGDLVVVAAPQVALIDRARDRTVRVLSTSRVA